MNKIVEFQKENNLTADGVIGKKTIAKMKEVWNICSEEELTDLLVHSNYGECLFKTDVEGKEHLVAEEGLRLKSYLDTVGVWTIGVGNTFYEDGTKVKKGEVITKERALSLMSNVLDMFEDNINKVVSFPINQNQFNALVSFSYNIGTGAFNKSTLLKLVNKGDIEGASNQFIVWTKQKELTKRRIREKALFLKTLSK